MFQNKNATKSKLLETLSQHFASSTFKSYYSLQKVLYYATIFSRYTRCGVVRRNQSPSKNCQLQQAKQLLSLSLLKLNLQSLCRVQKKFFIANNEKFLCTLYLFRDGVSLKIAYLSNEKRGAQNECENIKNQRNIAIFLSKRLLIVFQVTSCA